MAKTYDFSSVQEQLQEMPIRKRKLYDELSGDNEKRAEIGEAIATLETHFDTEYITGRAVALQVLFELEANLQGWDKMRRQGISEYKDGNISIAVSQGAVSPEVGRIIELEMYPSGYPVYSGRMI